MMLLRCGHSLKVWKIKPLAPLEFFSPLHFFKKGFSNRAKMSQTKMQNTLLELIWRYQAAVAGWGSDRGWQEFWFWTECIHQHFHLLDSPHSPLVAKTNALILKVVVAYCFYCGQTLLMGLYCVSMGVYWWSAWTHPLRMTDRNAP